MNIDCEIIFINGTFSATDPTIIEGLIRNFGMPGSRKSLYSTLIFLYPAVFKFVSYEFFTKSHFGWL